MSTLIFSPPVPPCTGAESSVCEAIETNAIADNFHTATLHPLQVPNVCGASFRSTVPFSSFHVGEQFSFAPRHAPLHHRTLPGGTFSFTPVEARGGSCCEGGEWKARGENNMKTKQKTMSYSVGSPFLAFPARPMIDERWGITISSSAGIPEAAVF